MKKRETGLKEHPIEHHKDTTRIKQDLKLLIFIAGLTDDRAYSNIVALEPAR